MFRFTWQTGLNKLEKNDSFMLPQNFPTFFFICRDIFLSMLYNNKTIQI